MDLKEELKPKPGEDAVEYAERTEVALQRHHQETGECFRSHAVLPGEGPGEALARIKVLNEADGIHSAARERRRQETPQETPQDTQRKEKYMTRTIDESSRSYRMKSQERDVERAVSEFEEKKRRLYRKGGTRVFGEAEHSERMGKLTSELSEKAEAVIAEAEEDAREYETEALGHSYTDPTKGLTSAEFGRLFAAAPLVREDCEALALDALVERLRAVAAGSDKLPKVLHARYAKSRAEAMDRRMAQAARGGGSVSPEDTASLRALREAVSELEALKRQQSAGRQRERPRARAGSLRRSSVEGSLRQTARMRGRDRSVGSTRGALCSGAYEAEAEGERRWGLGADSGGWSAKPARRW